MALVAVLCLVCVVCLVRVLRPARSAPRFAAAPLAAAASLPAAAPLQAAAGEADRAGAALRQGQAVVPVPVPVPSPAATRYYRSGNVLWLISTLWGFLVPAAILFSGFSARLRAWARRIGRSWYGTLVAYVVLFGLTVFVADFALEYYAGFVRPHAYGLSSQTLIKWLHDQLTGLGLGLCAGALFLWIPYLLLRHATRRWWLYTWIVSVPLLLCVAFIQPIWIAPLFNHFGPMQDKALESRILELADRAGIDGAKVYEVNKSVDTNELNAYVAGIGDTKRIVLWDTIIRQFTPDELLVVMGHEMGHYVLGHVWRLLIATAALLLAALWLIHRSSGWILRHLGARMSVTELSDVASWPLLLLISGVLLFALQPALLAYSRHLEHEADRFGLEITHDNHACATAFAKFVRHDLSYPSPGALYEFWRASHPSVAERIEFCNGYHPWLEGQPGRYARYFKPPRPQPPVGRAAAPASPRHAAAAVHGQDLAAHEGRIGGEEQHGAGDVLG